MNTTFRKHMPLHIFIVCAVMAHLELALRLRYTITISPAPYNPSTDH